MNSLKISVITPSYNQGRFIEKNIRSVIEQDHADKEHIVVDGGSKDESVSVIKAHESHLAYWVSERDNGQSSAINKGFRLATGDIICWLNSDDYFEPGALSYIAAYFAEHPDIDMICGHTRVVDPDGNEFYVYRGRYAGRDALVKFWLDYYNMHQPSIFWRRKVYDKIGGLNEKLHLTMDYDYWLRISQYFQVANVDRILSAAIKHEDQKTADNCVGYRRAQLRNVIRYYGFPWHPRSYPYTAALYWHLLKTSAKICLGRRTYYH